MKGLTWRVVVVVFTIVFGLYLLTPTILKYKFGKQISRVSKPDDPWYYSLFPAETLKLGLDLVGGLHLVLGIDFAEVNRDAIAKLKNELKEVAEREKVEGLTFDTTNDNRITVAYTGEEQWKRMDALIGKDFGQLLDFEGQSNNVATLRMTTLYEGEVRRRAVDQSLETLRNRIDEFGIAEPIITRQGEEKLLVQFPGVSETSRLKEIISRTAKLSFQVVVSGPEEPGGPPAETELAKLVEQFQKEKNTKPDPSKPMSLYVRELNTWAQPKIPPGTEILFKKKLNVNTREFEYTPYLLKRDALVTGEDLQDASYNYDPETNLPIVLFQMTPLGGQKFEKATGENVRKYMAIILDGTVHSAPQIRERIPGGRAKIDMGSAGRSSDEVLNDAKDTSLVLRSGALPARLEFLEERVIGPSLGADSIRAGSISLTVGVLVVFVFMLIYYRTSGTVAVFALVMNLLFILAAMAAFEGTLTLPGLAGMTLSLGMSVDANVLIFEHMREELRSGKSVAVALGEGYTRAAPAIWDANITAILSALVLMSFGYGPIRGFAVTLLMGLISSVYTAVFVTRVFFDYFVIAKNRKTISV